jgi:hypothetical protein
MDDLPFDFTEYVSQRLGLPGEETKRLLVAWLRSYEPVTRRPIRTLARTRGAPEHGEHAELLKRAG